MVYFSDVLNYVIRMYNPTTKEISTVAGTFGLPSFYGDGILATNARLSRITEGVAVDRNGLLYFADPIINIIRMVNTTSGIISTVAGTPGSYGFSGDGGPATIARLDSPSGVAVDRNGLLLYIADSSNGRIRMVNTITKEISTVAGTGPFVDFSGDGGLATDAGLRSPYGVAVDRNGHLYIADTLNFVIRMVNITTGIISTVAGTPGSYGFSGDGGPATDARLGFPHDVAVDRNGLLFIAETNNNVIRMVNTVTGMISTVAGTYGVGVGFDGDGGRATNALLSNPYGVAVDEAGRVYISDTGNNRIRTAPPCIHIYMYI
jgi:DNA-binding beta-propeller fold protein YncE